MPENSFQKPDAHRNKLLRSLPIVEWTRVQRHLEPVQLKVGQVISESALPLRHAYLPITSTIALVYLSVDGTSTEIAGVGNEGLVGIPLFMGGGGAPGRAVVQSAGLAYRMTGESLNVEFQRAGAMQRLLLLYAQAHLMLVSQTAVCNRQHSVDQRLSRWLLSSLDRLDAMELVITHESISKSLGVRREGVSESAGKLQRAGIIESSRGLLTVVDRPRLEASCCECYGVMRREYLRLLGGFTRSTGRSTLSIRGTVSWSNAAMRSENAAHTFA